MKLTIEPIAARLRSPFTSAAGSVTTRPLLLVTLCGEDGVCGYGEAAPLESYDGVSVDACREALEDCRAPVAGFADAAEREEVLSACRHAAALPQAVAALDLALWDLAARRAGVPVWWLLGARSPASIEVNGTIAAADRAGASGQAARAREAGFSCIKVKVGLGDDPGRLAAVRAAAGPAMAIRIDANGAWSAEQAIAMLRVLEPIGIELCEEPAPGLDAIAQVAGAASVPVALDESARLPGALADRYADAVCLKVSGCGGITGVVDAATRARSTGYDVYLASTLDGPLGIAAALHAAAALAPDRPCGLATLGLFDGRSDPFPADRGRIAVPGGAGLGVEVEGWYRVSGL